MQSCRSLGASVALGFNIDLKPVGVPPNPITGIDNVTKWRSLPTGVDRYSFYAGLPDYINVFRR
jgi:hypothetical protein